MEKQQKPKKRSRLTVQTELELPENTESTEQTERSRQVYWFLTNRNNLLDILSSSMIKPASLYTKYYPDLGTFCTESVPLLIENVPSALIDAVIEDNPELFPVLLEVDISMMNGTVETITENYEVEQKELSSILGGICIIVNGVIPGSCIRSVYFRSDAEKEEHVARVYENIRIENIPLKVSPNSFENPAPIDRAIFLDKLGQINKIAKLDRREMFRSADALGGALLTSGRAVEDIPLIQAQVVVNLLSALSNPQSVLDTMSTIQQVSLASRWLTLLPSLLLTSNLAEERQSESITQLSEVVDIARRFFHTTSDIFDLLLFETTVNILAHKTPDKYYSEEALQLISTSFEKKLRLFLGDQHDPVKQHYAKILSAISSVVHNTMDISDFPSSGSPVATSLLFFLLRSDPKSAFSWYTDLPDTLADTLVTTVAFAGLLYGRAMTPVEYRANRHFEEFVDDILVQNINRANGGLLWHEKPIQIDISQKDSKGMVTQTIGTSEKILLRRAIQSSSRSELIAKRKLQSNVPQTKTQHKIDQRGTQDHSHTPQSNTLKRLLAADFRKGVEKDIAIYLCSIENWDDCISTVFSLEGRKFILTTAVDIHKPELRIQGLAPIPSDISIQGEKFRKHLAESWSSLSEKTRLEIESRLMSEDKL